MVAKIAEFNALIQRNAERNGFRFANPTSRFLGDELCGEGESGSGARSTAASSTSSPPARPR